LICTKSAACVANGRQVKLQQRQWLSLLWYKFFKLFIIILTFLGYRVLKNINGLFYY